MPQKVKKIIIIGGVAGGASAAARARRLSEDASITILEKGPYVSFANCGLPYALGGLIEDREELLLQTPESLKERFNLDVLINTEALAIDRTQDTVKARNLITGQELILSYDFLILSPGAEAIRPALPGMNSKNVFTLQTLPDLDKIQTCISETNLKSAAVIGGGFIGIEAAENLVKRGIEVTLIERGDQIFPPADRDTAEFLHQEMKTHGVHLLLNSELKSIESAPGRKSKLTLARGNAEQVIETDLIIMAIGVRPRTQLAQSSGLTIGKTGGIQVDEFMRTSDPKIYAVGDVIETTQPQSGRASYIPLAGPANRQGRIAADHIFGKTPAYRGTIGTAVCQVFDLTVATTGLSVKALQKQGTPFDWVTVHPNHHAGYYPGAEQMTLKLIFNPENSKILGAQIVGKAGVDKRIDVLSMAIQTALTVEDLEHLELAYAPPYGSAKDPVNMAGFVASNVIRGDTRLIHTDQLKQTHPSSIQLIDVRSPQEYERGSIPNSKNIPIDDLRSRLSEIKQEVPVVVYCQVGFRGYLAYRILTQKGFQVTNLNGGYRSWKASPQS